MCNAVQKFKLLRIYFNIIQWNFLCGFFVLFCFSFLTVFFIFLFFYFGSRSNAVWREHAFFQSPSNCGTKASLFSLDPAALFAVSRAVATRPRQALQPSSGQLNGPSCAAAFGVLGEKCCSQPSAVTGNLQGAEESVAFSSHCRDSEGEGS